MAVTENQKARVAEQMRVMVEAAETAAQGRSPEVLTAAVQGATSGVAQGSDVLGSSLQIATQRTSDFVYRVVIGVLSAIALFGAVAFFWAVLDGDAGTQSTDVLTLVLPIVTGLLGLFARSPLEKRPAGEGA